MEERKIYYYSSETMRALIESINKARLHREDIILIFHDGKNYTVVYEL